MRPELKAFHEGIMKYNREELGADMMINWHGMLSQRGKAVSDIIKWMFVYCYPGGEAERELALRYIPKLKLDDWKAIKAGMLSSVFGETEQFVMWVHNLDTIYALEYK